MENYVKPEFTVEDMEEKDVITTSVTDEKDDWETGGSPFNNL